MNGRPIVCGWNFNLLLLKLQPAIFPLSQQVIRFHELPTDTTQRFLEYGTSYYA